MPAKKAKPKFETPRIMHDAPLRDEDKAYFHFDQFAATFSRLIADKETRTPLTIGISGAWGSGKTTLLKRVKTMLDTGQGFFEQAEKDDFRLCKTVWFDAWKYTEGDELLVALTRVILTAMKGDGFKNRLKAWWEDPTQPSYEMAEMFLNAFQFKFGGLGFQVDAEKHKKESLFETHTAFFDYFDEAFEILLSRWVHGKGNYEEIDESKGALVIFIDDLDRCLPKQAVQTLEAIKLFLDKKGCTFFLGADIRRLQSAVSAHYKDTGVLDDSPDEYLEKVIQLRFNLPPIPQEKMDNFVMQQITAESPLYKHWKTVVAGAGSNPRKVKTFLNDVNLRWAIWQNTGEADRVDYDMFVSWEVLMRSSSKFRERLFNIRPTSRDDYELVTSLLENAFKWAGGDGDKPDEAAAASFKDDVNEQMRRVLREIRPFRGRFTPQALDQLLHLSAPPADEEPAPVKEAEISPEAPEAETPEIMGEKARLHGKAEAFQPSDLQLETEFAEMPFVKIPAGKFIMGSKEDNKLAFGDERPQHTVDIPYEYYMARFPVTNADYQRFAGSKFKVAGGKENHPVVNVSWNDAQKYIAWLNENHAEGLSQGYHFVLPSEAEWEKAARGEYGNEWPWGNEFDKNKCNSKEGGIGGTSPVDAYPPGASPYGVMDMVGNVWEWTHSLLKDYPYEASDGREDEGASGVRVLRGGAFNNNMNNARCAYRNNNNPDNHNNNIGFRVAVSASPFSPVK